MKRHIVNLIAIIFFFLTIASVIAEEAEQPNKYRKGLQNFGMNKPHLLFHLGTRSPVSVNYGMGYWMNNPSDENRSYFTNARLWYETKRDELYVNMVCHDG